MVKKLSSRLIAVLLALMLLVPMVTVPASAAENLTTATLNFTINGLTYPVTVTGTKTSKNYEGEMTFDDTEKWLKFGGTGFTSGSRKQSNQFKLTMTIPANSVIGFDYHEEIIGSMSRKWILYSTDGKTTGDQEITPVDGVHYTIGAGDKSTPVTFQFFTAVGDTNSFEALLDNITLSISQDYSVTVNGAANGTVTVIDEDVAAGGSVVHSVTTAEGLYMSAAPASGYVFAGYSVNGGDVLVGSCSTDASKTAYQYTYFPTEDNTTLTPIFVPKTTQAFLVGNETNGYRLVSDFGSAVGLAASGSNIIVLTDSTIPAGDYTIPSGVTVIIPNNIAKVAYTDDPNAVLSTSTPRVYTRLTAESGANLTFADGSAMSIAGNLYAPGGGKSSSVTGYYGQLTVNEGASVVFGSGSALYAWGFATGDGVIECKSESQVYEAFQICDFAGGGISKDLVYREDKAFPFSQYYVQNVECMLKLYAGATETVVGAVYVGGSPVATPVSTTFIGNTDSLFTIKEGYVLKYYDAEQDKLVCRIEGKVEIGSIVVPLTSMMEIQSAYFQLPINNIGVEVGAGSDVVINQNIQLLPDSYVKVDNQASLTVNSEIYLIDESDWVGQNRVFDKVNCRPLVYSATRYDTYGSGSSSRTANGDMTSAALDNNGTVIIDEGTINTTPGGAVITSSEGTGSFKNIHNYLGMDIVLLDFSSSSDMVIIDTPETQVADFDNPDESATYYYDSARGVWYTTPVSVYFVKDGATIASFEDVDYGTAITPPDAAKENTAQVRYNFVGWRSSLDNAIYQPADITTAFENVTYTAVYTTAASTYTVTWVNDDGTVLETDNNVAYGATPSYDGAEPEKAAEGGVTYTFAGWTPEIAAVISDITYTATYTATEPDYETTHSLSLDGQIQTNFYWDLPEGADPADYTVKFEFMGKTSEETTLTAAPYGYKSSFAVNAPEMTCDIIATLCYKGDPVAADRFTPADYAKSYTYAESATELEIDQPYLIGKINGSVNWSRPSPKHLLTLNTAAEGTEYMIQDVPLTAGDTFKVVIYKGENTYWWYPDGDNNNYTISANGVYNIYFREADYDGSEWWYKHLRVETVSLENTAYRNALLPTVVQSTLNYGAKAQAYFGIRPDDPADGVSHLAHKGVFDEVTQDMINAKLGDADTRDLYTEMDAFRDYGLEYYGSSLVMNAGTKIKLYYGVENKELFDACKDSFTFGGAPCTPTYASSDVVCFTLDGVAAVDLNTRYTLTNGSVSVSYAALDYATLCLDDKNAAEDREKKLYELTQALYWYNVYADAYFG